MSNLATSVDKKLCNTEIEALTAEIREISSKQKLLARPALQSFLNFIIKPVDISPVAAAGLLRKWLSRIQLAESLVKVFTLPHLVPTR
jgi:hypothetical protein